MTRDEAYEIAAQQGFEGNIFFVEQDGGVGRIDTVRITLEDESGHVSLWVAEVSEANGCEMFDAWTPETESFYREQVAALKAAKKSRRKVAKV